MQPIFSEGANEELLMAEMQALSNSDWILDEEQMGITKTYYFKTYTKALVSLYIYTYTLTTLFFLST